MQVELGAYAKLTIELGAYAKLDMVLTLISVTLVFQSVVGVNLLP